MRGCCLLSVALLAASWGCGGPSAPSRPNFILVLTDDQGYGDIGVHGNERIRTPTLDRFAGESVGFSRFYVETFCAPTRAALLTGRHYYRSGVMHPSRGGAKMHGDETTLAEMLRAAGYRTALFGKWHLGDNYPMRPPDQGFEETLWHKAGGIDQAPDKPNSYFDPELWHGGEKVKTEGYCTDVFFDAALSFVERHRDEPLFLYIPTNAPHTPLQVPDRYWRPYAEAGLDETTARVYGMVENIDDNMKRLLDKLDELALSERTYVVFLSDNGPQQRRYTAGLRDRKGSNYDGGIRAISYWRGPGWAPKKVDRLAAHIDVAPTLLDLADAAAPTDRQFDGLSLRPLLEGPAPADWPDRTLFLQVHRGLQPKLYQNAAVVTQRWKLVLGPGVTEVEDWAPPSSGPPAELYDLEADPGEERDLAAAAPEVVAGLLRQYETWFADVSSTREFTPGVIRLGNDAENPAVLCRYQDSTYVGGKPTSWAVEIERSGRYRARVNEPADGPGTVHVDWNGERSSAPADSPSAGAVVELKAGAGRLDIWFEPRGGQRTVYTANDTLGDVTLERLN